MNILIVDDEIEALENYRKLLKPAGYHVTTVQEPLTALEEYKKGGVDLLITDYRMPEMTGIELLAKVKECDPKARVIIITAYGDTKTAIEAINHHAYAFFGKPVDVSELIKTLRCVEKEINHETTEIINVEQLKLENRSLKTTYEELRKILESYR